MAAPSVPIDHNNRAKIYFDLGGYENAIQDFTKAIELNPDFALAYAYRGISYRFLGNITQANADETTACCLDSKYC